jgi:5-hydroxyisourate hydrolase
VSTLSTHVLDAVTGTPAAGVAVRLLDSSGAVLAEAVTDDDGRVRRFTLDPLPAGTYRLDFRTGDWFAARGIAAFYPEVVVAFSVGAEGGHLHVPLLLSPFAYSTYRGS